MRIDIANLGRGRILAGAPAGHASLARLLSELPVNVERAEPVFLDFQNVDVATASYLRESVIAFKDFVRKQRPIYYPVLANVSDVIRDEFWILLRARGDAIIMCELDDTENVLNAELIGELEPKQQLTIELVERHGETDAATLMERYGASEKTTRTTAWNNRLASLSHLGLIIEENIGRSKRYRPIFGGLS